MNHKYDKPDKYITINDDRSLQAIKIDINKVIKKLYQFWNHSAKDIHITNPPPEKIANYGLDPKDQYFNRRELPEKLKKLSRQYNGNTKKIWKVLTAHKDNYKEEIDFIKSEWYHCLYGYWVYINGKPTWIPPMQYLHLNYATGNYMTRDRKTGKRIASLYPEYRDVDRRRTIAYHFIQTNTETFERLDKKGNAIPEEDGTYKMRDTGKRTFFGFASPKGRRIGETLRALVYMYFVASVNAGPEAYASMIADKESTVLNHWNQKFIPMWRKLPFFLKPNTENTNRPKRNLSFKAVGLKENSKKNEDNDTLELDGKIDYADITSGSYYDNTKLTGVLLYDETGKLPTLDVMKELNLIKPSMSQGGGMEINRLVLAWLPSTVEEMELKGGSHYKKLCEGSNYYVRSHNTGQTTTGLCVIFFSAVDGMEGFVGPYGESIIDTPTPEQSRFINSTIGSLEAVKSVIAQLESDPTPANILALTQYKRQNPIEYADIWRGMAGDLGLDMKKMEERADELRRLNSLGQDRRIKGDFVWVIPGQGAMKADKFWELGLQNYDFEGKAYVDFIPNENGRFFVSRTLPREGSNRVQKNWQTDHYEPIDDTIFWAGGDPTSYHDPNQSKAREDKSGNSSFTMGVFFAYQSELDKGKPVNEWQSNKFVCTYQNKLDSDDIQAEECLMMCIYYGCKIFPERNIPIIVKHFITRGYRGLLRHAWLANIQDYRDKPGYHLGAEQPMDDLISALREYIAFYVQNEDHLELIECWMKFKSKKDLTNLDLASFSGGALLGYKQREMVLGSQKWEDEEDKNEGPGIETIYGKMR